MPKYQEFKGKKRRRKTVDKPIVAVQTCVCGKVAYRSRKDAKTRGRKLHQGQGIREYVCRQDDRWWHVTTMGAAATERYRDYEALGRQPYAVWDEEGESQ